MKKLKQKKSSLRNLSLLLFLLLSLSSCANISTLDGPVCIEMNIEKGFCTTPITGKDQWVDETNLLEGKTWFEMRPYMILVPPSTWARIKKYIIKQCKLNPKSCDESISSWDRTIQTIDSQLSSKMQ